MTKTILKWAGNKTKVMPAIINYFPENYSDYIEPFAGALGSFLNSGVTINNHEVYLNDLNEEIINLFLLMRTDCKLIVDKANSLPRDKESYYEIRNWDRLDNWKNRNKIEKAARTIYLNKLCFNGLYRINPKKGYFNTPYGSHRKSDLLSIKDANKFVIATKNVNFSSEDCFDFARKNYNSNSLFYFDPPYVNPKEPKKEFGGYLGGFGWQEQLNLRDLCLELYENGHNVIISNAYCKETQELYNNFTQNTVKAPRSISRNASGRKPVLEMLATLIQQ
tara:strand:+ start:51 stop:884 length:834 start_codon:yes stop_codon:yes gene_type:complete